MIVGCVLLTLLAFTQHSEIVPESSSSPCVVINATYPNAPADYYLEPDSNFPPGIEGSAAAAWNNPSCNPNGTGFPQFATSPVAGATPLPLHYTSGLNPTNHQSCGQV